MSRRMFSDDITSTDSFLDMPTSSQLLYFHLGMSADDDGFIANPKMIMRVIGGSADDLKLLLAKKFLLQFESGVCVVKHWRINNQIRKDRYRETKYINEKTSLFVRENGSYSFNPEHALPVPKGHFSPDSLPFGNHLATNGQPSIGKVRLVKVSLEDNTFQSFWNSYPNKTNKKKASELWVSKKLDLKLDEILDFIARAKNTDRWQKGFIKAPDVFLRNESWEDDLSAYGEANKIKVYKNENRVDYAEKLKDKIIKTK